MRDKNNFISKIFNLKNRTIVLTGSSGLLGTQYSHTLSEAGANVVLVDVDAKRNKKLESILCQKYHTRPMSCNVDISNPSDVDQLTNDVLSEYGKIDGLINNAMYNPRVNSQNVAVPFESFPHQIWEQTLAVNLTGVFSCSQKIGAVMAKQKKGVIVNISSIYGIVGADQRIYGKSNLNSPVSYAVTKGAIINLTRYLAAYWHRKNIRVNTLSLGGVLDRTYQNKEFIKKYSERTMLGRMANKEEYRGPLLFLVSDASSYMTGANLIIDGGWTAW